MNSSTWYARMAKAASRLVLLSAHARTSTGLGLLDTDSPEA